MGVKLADWLYCSPRLYIDVEQICTTVKHVLMSLNGLIRILRLFCPALVLPPQLLVQICPLLQVLEHKEKSSIYGIYWQSIVVMCSYGPLLMSGYYLRGLLGVIISQLPLITYMASYYT